MSTSVKKYRLLILLILLVVANIFLFSLEFHSSRKDLTFAALDVGQGDGLFIESPTGTQMLFDAGPAHSILGSLSRVMSPFDRSIDGIVITNPDADHIGGFLEILKNYKVGAVFESGTVNDSKTYQNLQAEIKAQNIPHFLAEKGMRFDLGGGTAIDVLFPDRDVSLWSTNDGSVVARLSYGETSVMLTGDSTALTEKVILEGTSPDALISTVLKVGHHGSRTSTSQAFAKVVSPTYAVISDGKENKYGHPNQNTLDTLASVGAEIFRTDLLGTVIMNSDGKNIKFSFKK